MRVCRPNPRVCANASAATQPVSRHLKRELRQLVSSTERGGMADSLTRGRVEELQVALESSTAGLPVDWSLLEGTWNVIYTTARDVTGIVRNDPRLPYKSLMVGQEYSWGAGRQEVRGVVTNIIEVELLPFFLQGTTFSINVEADFAISACRSIGLRFRSVSLRRLEPGANLQGLLAPALLPRGWWNLQTLDFIRSLDLTFMFPIKGSADAAIPSSLDITYLDSDMLIGRAQGGGGVYMFERLPTRSHEL